MKARSAALRAVFVLVSILLFMAIAGAAEVKVMFSGGFSAALQELGPEFERTTGNKIVLISGPSMGSTPQAIPNRIQRGEPVDVVIMVGYALDDLIKQGKVISGSRVDLAQSGVGVAVRAGTPKPDISSADALKRTLLRAKSIAYSDSASGAYVSTELYQRLGIADQSKRQEQEDSGRAGWQGGCTRRSRDRIPADQRASSCIRHRAGRTTAVRSSEVHSVFRWGRNRCQGSRGGKSVYQISRLAGRCPCHHEDRHGTHGHHETEVMGCIGRYAPAKQWAAGREFQMRMRLR